MGVEIRGLANPPESAPLRRPSSDTQSVLRVQAPSPLNPPVCSYLIDKATSRCNYCERPHNVFGAYTPPSARPTHIVAELKYNKYTKYSTLLPAKTIRRMSSNTCFFEQITQLYTIFLRSWETLRKPHTFPTTLLPTQYKIN